MDPFLQAAAECSPGSSLHMPTLTLVVVGIRRYILSQHSRDVLLGKHPFPEPRWIEQQYLQNCLYDLLLWNQSGQQKRALRVVLSPSLNILIDAGELKEGSVTSVPENSIQMRISEAEPNGSKFFIVKELVVEGFIRDIPQGDWWTPFRVENFRERFSSVFPAMNSAGYYLPTYDDDSAGVIDPVHPAHLLHREELPKTSVTGYVIAKSRLHHFGNKSWKGARFPFMFSVVLRLEPPFMNHEKISQSFSFPVLDSSQL